MRRVDVVIPVFRGYDETRSCIESVLATVGDTRVILINDASPEPEITELLRSYQAAEDRVVLLENEQNLGFVATVNRGMEYDLERDVVLLNSDVEVANDWLLRLREAAYYSERVASVTPFANNATITSFPNFCQDNSLLFGLSVEEIDRCFARRALASSMIEIPTGIGCCMYMRRDCMNAVGLFDVETFGRGYGEENDWCQRADAAGWPNYHLGNCFIYHKGGVSFAEEQHPRIEQAMTILDQRYPSYHQDIQQYISQDPARALRTETLIQLFAMQDKPKVVCISHKLGGGAQQHVDELASYYQGEALFIQLTPEIEGQTVTLSFFDQGKRLKDGLHFDINQEYDKLLELLRALGVGHVHFHHAMGVHPRLWVLAEALGCQHDLTIHDYYLVNGNPTLTDQEARYVDCEREDFDQACAGHYPLPEGLTASQWRLNQELLVSTARQVIFPSQDCATRFQRFFNTPNAVVAWHPDYLSSQPYPEPLWRYTGGRPLRVLVAGAISREKGAELLEAVADALPSAEVEFHLMGYAYRALSSSVKTYGPYDNSQVAGLVQDIAPDVIWYPALWPETYSYTLSIALRLGLPAVVPNLGAFAERVAGRPFTAVCPWDQSVEQWRDFWSKLASSKQLKSAPPHREGNDVLSEQQFYPAHYLRGIAPRAASLPDGFMGQLTANLHVGVAELSASERLLARMWRLSRHPIFASFLRLVPFRLQRAVKRRLSARPMHDVLR